MIRLPDLKKLRLDNQTLIIIGIISIALLYVDISIVFKTQLNSLGALNKKITKLKTDMRALKKELSNVDLTKIALGPQAAALKSKRIISDGEVPFLLQQVSDMATRNDVRIMQIKPGSLRDPKTGKEAKAKEKDEVIDGKTFSPFSITLVLTSDYHSMGSFINSLENNDMFMAIQEMKVARTKENIGLENITLTLKTYVRK